MLADCALYEGSQRQAADLPFSIVSENFVLMVSENSGRHVARQRYCGYAFAAESDFHCRPLEALL